jgi:hypothetical protein
MLSQPILELSNLLIDRHRDLWRDRFGDATFDQEANESAYAAHVLGRDVMLPAAAGTFTSMSRKSPDHTVIDFDQNDVRPAQPLAKVTGGIPVICHGQPRVPKSR